MIRDWKITSGSGRCSHTERPFEDEEMFHTAIFRDEEAEGEAFIRRDYSEDAWEELSASLQPFSFWRSKFIVPKTGEEPEAVGQEDAESLLRKLVDEGGEEFDNVRYVLAVMLERKKILRQTDAQESESGRILFYEHRHTGETLLITDPQLKLDQVDAVQEEVTTLLEGRTPAQPEPAEEPRTEETEETEEKGSE